MCLQIITRRVDLFTDNITNSCYRYQKHAEHACIQISSQVEKYNTHRELYNAIDQVVINGDIHPETEVDKHVAKLFHMDFQQSGIHLDEKTRESVVDLNDEILQLGQNFTSNIQAPVIIDKSVIPSNLHHFFHQQGGNIIVTGSQIDSPTEKAREAAFKVYYWNDPSKELILHTLLSKRNELAQVCSFDTFAERAMLDSLAQNPSTVKLFLGKNIKFQCILVKHVFFYSKTV